MRAAVTTRYGPPDVVEVRDVPTPTPAATWVTNASPWSFSFVVVIPVTH
jgi:hypothetical protein